MQELAGEDRRPGEPGGYQGIGCRRICCSRGSRQHQLVKEHQRVDDDQPDGHDGRRAGRDDVAERDHSVRTSSIPRLNWLMLALHGAAEQSPSRRPLARQTDRRAFLLGGVAAPRRAALSRVQARPRWDASPFSLGVASGDPSDDGVVLWTRLAPDPLNGGGMPPAPVEVRWEVAEDDGCAASSRAAARRRPPTWATPCTWRSRASSRTGEYWYRFHAGDATSRIGRTRTLPRAKDDCRSAAVRVRLVPALRDGVLHRVPPSGDRRSRPRVPPRRLHLRRTGARRPAARGITASSWRRWRTIATATRNTGLDPDLQTAHAAFPWIVTPDDHEVDNNYADAIVRKQRSARCVPDATRRRLPGVLRAHAAAAAFDPVGAEHSALPSRSPTASSRRSSCSTRASSAATRRVATAPRRRARACPIQARRCSGRRRRSGCSTRCRARAARWNVHAAAGDDGQSRPDAGPRRALLHGPVVRLRRARARGCSNSSARAGRPIPSSSPATSTATGSTI